VLINKAKPTHKEELNKTVSETKSVKELKPGEKKGARVINNKDVNNKHQPSTYIPAKLITRTKQSETYQNDYLDIDNMSYEQLLALEEKVGKVNKGLDSTQIEVLFINK